MSRLSFQNGCQYGSWLLSLRLTYVETKISLLWAVDLINKILKNIELFHYEFHNYQLACRLEEFSVSNAVPQSQNTMVYLSEATA